MPNHVEKSFNNTGCLFEVTPEAPCPLGKPQCTNMCDYKQYLGKFLLMGVEWNYLIRFFKMYRRWQERYWKKYIESV